MKFYQSPLVICAACLIAIGIYFAVDTILNLQSWGLLIGIPALIVGGIGLVLHFIINSFVKLKLKNKIIIELFILAATIIWFTFYF